MTFHLLNFLFFFVLFINLLLVVLNKKPTRNVEITAEEEKLRDPEGFAAICELHQLMDDDKSGSIDRSESADFLKEDLKIGGGSDRELREKAFHQNNDESITVDDLWESWFQSDERNWNNKEIVQWLINDVRLPQYEANFVEKKVNGISLPRLAIQNSSYITNILGIKNFVHRQKIQLKALDLVLFGFQDRSSRVKDIALAILLVLLVFVLIVFKVYKNSSKRQMAELASKLSELKIMENDFEDAEQCIEKDRQFPKSNIESEHIEALKCKLMEAERQIEMNGFDSISYSLQPLLRQTYEIEISYINSQKFECLNEMREAKEFVDKMRRKHTGIVSSFKIATGTSSGTDEIDIKIFSLKARMEKIKISMDECQQRWMEIESLCGFSITGPFGTINNTILKSKALFPTFKKIKDADHALNDDMYAKKNNVDATSFYNSSINDPIKKTFSCQNINNSTSNESSVFENNSNLSKNLNNKNLYQNQYNHPISSNKLIHILSDASSSNESILQKKANPISLFKKKKLKNEQRQFDK